jgi:hypothetical protein
MPTDLAKVKELFFAVVELSAADRATYLDTACAGDAELREQVAALLQSHENSGELLPRSPAEMLQNVGATEAEGTAAFPRPGDQSITMNEQQAGESNELRFLTPTTKPGQLGQLGPYEVQTILGKGGFGVVLRGFDERLHRVVAIKVLAPAYAANGAARKRFIREARAAAAVKNEHVVGIHDVQGDAEPPYLVMEYIDGISLQDKIEKRGSLDIKEILRIGMQIAEGLAAAHKQGLVHRDIKPANILLENGVERVKITDFGLARAVDDASITQSGTVAGTPMYMSPEQAEGLPIDHRSDLFSLGTVLYAMCTGHPAFRASGTHAVLKRVIDASPRPIREVNNEIPEWLCEIIAKLHAKKPEDRFQTAKEVAELLGQRLADVQAGREIGQRTESCKELAEAAVGPKRQTRIPRLVAALVILGTTLVLIACILFWPFQLFRSPNLTLWANQGDVDVVILQNGEEVAILHADKRTEIRLPAGSYQFKAKCAPGFEINSIGFETEGMGAGAHGARGAGDRGQIDVGWWDRVHMKITVLKKPVAAMKAPSEPGWAQLFNGKDLMGWKTHPEQPGSWEVKDKILIGSTRQSHLFTERADFANFHLRVEMKINLGGISGIRFRAPFELLRGKEAWQLIPAGGYYAEFHKFAGGSAKTGSVWRINQSPPADILFRMADDSLVQADVWHTYEVIADRNRFITKIDGREVANCVDSERMYAKGHIALQCFSSQTVVQFRKIEIKELPTEEPGWVQLFNGKDLAGWNFPKLTKGLWNYEDNALVLRDGDSPFYTMRDDYGDFHLRAEVKINKLGHGGIWFRARRADFTGYRAGVDANPDAPDRTGSLLSYTDAKKNRVRSLHKETTQAIRPDEWFRYEVIARRDEIMLLVNGQITAKVKDSKFHRGAIGLDMFPLTTTHWRKLEIKELPSEEPGWVKLFNGKNLDGWTGDTNVWSWKNDALIGTKLPKGSIQMHSLRHQATRKDFELKFQASLDNPGGQAAVIVRGKAGMHIGPKKDIGSFSTEWGSAKPLAAMNQADLEKALKADFNDFTIKCVGKRVTTSVNGVTTIDQEFADLPAEGTIAFKFFQGTTISPNVSIRNVEIHKIEIKELPPKSASPKAPPPAVAPFDAKKAKEHQDAWPSISASSPKSPTPSA